MFDKVRTCCLVLFPHPTFSAQSVSGFVPFLCNFYYWFTDRNIHNHTHIFRSLNPVAFPLKSLPDIQYQEVSKKYDYSFADNSSKKNFIFELINFFSLQQLSSTTACLCDVSLFQLINWALCRRQVCFPSAVSNFSDVLRQSVITPPDPLWIAD